MVRFRYIMNKNKPLVSVIMPTFNIERFVARAINSILTQSFTNFELLIIDDASTDKTLSLVRKYEKEDKRIRVVSNKKNSKIAESLNKAVKLSKAEIIARMDADDISHPDRLKMQYKLLKNKPKVAIVGANMIIIDSEGIPIYRREYPAKSPELKKLMFRYSPFAHPVVMFRKSVFEEFGGYDKTKVPCEDIDLWFKIGSKYKFATIQKHLLEYTLIDSSGRHKKLKALELLGFKIKINAMKKYGYRPSFYDVVYNFGQFVTLWFMPPKTRIWLYNILRSEGVI